VLLPSTHGGARLVVLLTYPSIPIAVAIAVAVLRYRLYEIDRIVSRTILYAVVTGVLVAVFAAAVIVLEAVLATFTQGETLAVAASTLLAFALFQPLRRGAAPGRPTLRPIAPQREPTSAAFYERMRDQRDLPALIANLDSTVREVMAPTRMEI